MLFNEQDVKKRYRNGVVVVDGSRAKSIESSLEYLGQRYVFCVSTETNYEIAMQIGTVKETCRDAARSGEVYRALSSPDNTAFNDAFQVVRNPDLIRRVLHRACQKEQERQEELDQRQWQQEQSDK